MKKLLFVTMAAACLMCCASCGEEEWEKEALEERLVGRWEGSEENSKDFMEFHEDGEFVKVLYYKNNIEYGENSYLYKDSLHGKWSAHIHVIDKVWYSADYHNNPNDYDRGGCLDIEWKNKNKSFIFNDRQFDKVSVKDWK